MISSPASRGSRSTPPKEFDHLWWYVSFQDGTCINAFNGCTNSTFPFDGFGVTPAMESLWDQAFSAGHQPDKVNGCLDPGHCYIWTPYGLNPEDDVLASVLVLETLPPYLTSGQASPTFDFGGPGEGAYVTWAVWSEMEAPSPSPVPLPPAAALLVGGLLTFFAKGRVRT